MKLLALPVAAAGNVTLSGNLGTLASPELVAFVPYDPDDASLEYGCDAYGCDAFTLSFDMHTSLGGLFGSRQQVDALFGFSSVLGDDYSGEWSDCLESGSRYCRSFTITLIDATLPKGASPPIFGRTLAWVKPPNDRVSFGGVSYNGVRTPSEKSPHSLSVRALGTCLASSQLCKSFPASARGGTPTQVQLDLGRSHLVYLELPDTARASSAGADSGSVTATTRQCSLLRVDSLDAQPMQSYPSAS